MSTPAEASVTIASVRSGMISDTAPTNVVLPAPNPPAMTIFVDAVSRLFRRGWASRAEGPQATQRPSYQFAAFIAGRVVGQCPVYSKVSRSHQIADQHTRD